MDPIPSYVADWQLARWMGCARWELDDLPIREVEEARVTMLAINQAQNDANKGRK